jgi:hypothetical protein
MVKAHDEMRVAESVPKLRRVAAIPPRIMENSSQERKVRSAAK